MAEHGSIPRIDPYAVGTEAANAPAPARPPENAAPFLWAWFVFSFAASGGLWQPLTREEIRQDLIGTTVAAGMFVFVVSVPWTLGLLWAYLSDRFPLLERRRVGWLVCACFIGAGAWLAAPFVPYAYWPWLVISCTLSLAAAMARISSAGALVEVSRLRGGPGKLAAAMVGCSSLAGLTWSPIRALLGDHGLGWWAALAVALAGSVAALALFVGESPRDPAPPVEERQKLWPYLRSRTFWGSLVVLACGDLLSKQIFVGLGARFQQTSGDEVQGMFSEVLNLSTVLGAALYALLCRRLALKLLLMVTVVLEPLASGVAFGWLDAKHPLAATALLALADGLAEAARADLVLRACPRGREALGFELLTRRAPFFPIAAVVLGTLSWMGGRDPMRHLHLVAPVLALLALLAIRLLPRELVDRRDGRAASPAQPA